MTFRGFMYLRILLVVMTCLLVPDVRRDGTALVLLAATGLPAWLAARASHRVIPMLAAHPILLCLDALFGFGVLWTVGDSMFYFPVTMITSALAGALCEWPALLLVCALQVALCQGLAYTSAVVDVQAVIGLPAAYPLAGYAGIGLHRFFSRYAAAEQAFAAAEERARLAREMHDSLAKTLHGIGLSIGVLPSRIRSSPELAEREADKIAHGVRVALAEARGLITDLRADGLSPPLPIAVRSAVTSWRESTGTAAEVSVAGWPDPPPPVRHEVLAICEEVLANVARHAEAGRVEVVLAVGRLIVSDDGRGFACPDDWASGFPGHFGLLGIAERARSVGGGLSVRSEPGRGTTVTVTWPDGGRE
jgi:signal transduction histidine kinase